MNLFPELEQRKPDLKIELVYFNDRELETNEIALSLLGNEYNQKSYKDYQQDAMDFEGFVRDQLEEDSLSLTEACRHLADPFHLDSISHLYYQLRFAEIILI